MPKTSATTRNVTPKSASVAGSNATNATNVQATVTGLSIAVGANKKYRVIASVWLGCDNTGGVFFNLAGPASSAVLVGVMTGSPTTSTGSQNIRLTAMGVIGNVAFMRANAAGGMMTMLAFITTGGTAGNLTMQFASAVNGQTSTVYIGSTMDLTETQG